VPDHIATLRELTVFVRPPSWIKGAYPTSKTKEEIRKDKKGRTEKAREEEGRDSFYHTNWESVVSLMLMWSVCVTK